MRFRGLIALLLMALGFVGMEMLVINQDHTIQAQRAQLRAASKDSHDLTVCSIELNGLHKQVLAAVEVPVVPQPKKKSIVPPAVPPACSRIDPPPYRWVEPWTLFTI